MTSFQRRFERQVRFDPFGPAGQEAVQGARVLLVGCGALGGVLAQTLTRVGVGTLVIVDRDLVEESNLPRQVLFEDRHAVDSVPKVDAARETLARIGGPTQIEAHAAHLDADNIEDFAEGADLVVDGTDNLATRYLINDYCVSEDRPWVYGGVVGAGGLVLAVVPGRGACLRCVFPEPPPPGALPTCDTAGVILPAVGAVASVQAGLAMRLLASPAKLEPAFLEIDVWSGEARRVNAPQDTNCPACIRREFPFLDASTERQAVTLCGRNTVQVRGPRGAPDLDALVVRLQGIARDVRRSGPLLRFAVDEHQITLFADGRALVEGTEDGEQALALYDRYVGS